MRNINATFIKNNEKAAITRVVNVFAFKFDHSMIYSEPLRVMFICSNPFHWPDKLQELGSFATQIAISDDTTMIPLELNTVYWQFIVRQFAHSCRYNRYPPPFSKLSRQDGMIFFVRREIPR